MEVRGIGMATPRTALEAPTSEDQLATQERAFHAQMDSLLPLYRGQFVAVSQGQVVGHDPDDEALAARLFAQLGDAPFYIGRVESTPVVYELPSPDLGS